MAAYGDYYPLLQQGCGEEEADGPLQSSSSVLYGVVDVAETGVATETTAPSLSVANPMSFAPIPNPCSCPGGWSFNASQPFMKKKKKKTCNSKKQKLYEMPPNPNDPDFEKRRKKAVESKKNRLGRELEFEVLEGTLLDLEGQIKHLRLEKTTTRQNIQNLEVQHTCQHQPWDDGYFQEYH